MEDPVYLLNELLMKLQDDVDLATDIPRSTRDRIMNEINECFGPVDILMKGVVS